MSLNVRRRTVYYVSTTKSQISLRIKFTIKHVIQSHRYPHEETLHPWLSKLHPMKIQIRLRECAVWSESSMGAHVRRNVFWSCGTYFSGR